MVWMGDEDDSRIRADSLSDEVPLWRMVDMKARSEAESVLDIANLSFFASVRVRLPEKVSFISSRSWVPRFCS